VQIRSPIRPIFYLFDFSVLDQLLRATVLS